MRLYLGDIEKLPDLYNFYDMPEEEFIELIVNTHELNSSPLLDELYDSYPDFSDLLQDFQTLNEHILRFCNRTGLCVRKTKAKVEKHLLKLIEKEFMQHAYHYLDKHSRTVCTAKDFESHCATCVADPWCKYHKKHKSRPYRHHLHLFRIISEQSCGLTSVVRWYGNAVVVQRCGNNGFIASRVKEFKTLNQIKAGLISGIACWVVRRQDTEHLLSKIQSRPLNTSCSQC